jgi:tRNA threonylcarbamoyladenosine biosynthesis protein TsaB
MRILGLEASTPVGTAAVLDGDELEGESWFCSSRTHSERMLQCIDDLLRGADLRTEDLDGLAVGLGPGSFTGLRIALSTAKGLAFALGVPLVGISTLEALAHNIPFWQGHICALLDARGGCVYGALFKATRAREPQRIEHDGVYEMASWLHRFKRATMFLGNGAVVYRKLITDLIGQHAHFPPPELLHPRGSVIARLGLRRLRSGVADDLDALVPLYARRPRAVGL